MFKQRSLAVLLVAGFFISFGETYSGDRADAFKFDAVQADLYGIGTLVALAANVTDHADELRVIQQLSLASQRFLEQLKYHRLILNSAMSNCADNDAVAKSQEVSRTWSDAASLVQSIVKKIGASPQ